MTDAPKPNARPCGACLHLDARALASGAQYCWQTFTWRKSEEVVVDCRHATRATGKEPPGRVWFNGERRA